MKQTSRKWHDNYKDLCEIRYQLHIAFKTDIREENFKSVQEALRLLDAHIWTEYKYGEPQKYDTCDKQLT